MPDTRDLQAVLAAAENAAAAGDPAAAEKLLREAASIQEISLGPLHPDLANTLNNLAVVCEISDKPADAERYYRRAADIAAKVLAADHPFVATSRKNLEDFCAARGVPVEVPPTAPKPPVAPPPQAAKAAPPTRDRAPQAPARTELRPAARPAQAATRVPAPVKRSNPLAISGAILAGLAIVLFVASRTWTSDAPSASGPVAAAASPAPAVTPPPAAGTPEVPDGRHATIAPLRTPGTSTSGPVPPGIVSARLCRTLTTGAVDWSCEAPTPPIGRGPIYFFTRLTSPRDTTVQHRWYRDGQLTQAVDLSIGANVGRGYRTYSRTVLDSFSVGEWRVELRSKDGTLLYEDRFTVR